MASFRQTQVLLDNGVQFRGWRESIQRWFCCLISECEENHLDISWRIRNDTKCVKKSVISPTSCSCPLFSPFLLGLADWLISLSSWHPWHGHHIRSCENGPAAILRCQSPPYFTVSPGWSNIFCSHWHPESSASCVSRLWAGPRVNFEAVTIAAIAIMFQFMLPWKCQNMTHGATWSSMTMNLGWNWRAIMLPTIEAEPKQKRTQCSDQINAGVEQTRCCLMVLPSLGDANPGISRKLLDTRSAAQNRRIDVVRGP